MKNIIITFIITATVVMISAFTTAAPESPEYIGSKSCKGCHNTKKGGKIYAKWEASKHANAFKTLQSAEADKIAKEKGYDTKAAETDFCIGCHVTGKNNADAKFGKKFKDDQGVGCESCHGAASGYKSKHNKPEKKAQAMKLGMEIPKIDAPETVALCTSCHNDQSPTYKGEFDLAKRWAEIEHALPE
jgi:Cytochrome c554 and c-prime